MTRWPVSFRNHTEILQKYIKDRDVEKHKCLGLYSSVSSNNDAQKGTNFHELNPTSSIILLILRADHGFLRDWKHQHSWEVCPGMANLILVSCTDMHKYICFNTADLIGL